MAALLLVRYDEHKDTEEVESMGRFGPTEIILLLALGLLLFGPRRLPEMGKALGRGVREFRDAMTGVERELSRTDTDGEPGEQQE